ncbi:MAG TPA: hypothetical protein VI248_04930 [Kineosporiaceae bacterium]
MGVTTTTEREVETRPATVGSVKWFSAVSGLAALAVLLQGLWAGLFLEHDGQRDAAAGWIDVHARCGEVALVLAAVAAVVAWVRLRNRRDLLVASSALVALLVLESWLGGLIRDDGQDTLTVVHVPVAMAIMGLAVWLPIRARHHRSSVR